MHIGEHIRQPALHLLLHIVQTLDEPVRDILERILRPVIKPIQGATVDQGGELPAPDSELVTHRGHAEDDVEVVAETLDVKLVDVVRVHRALELLHDLGERVSHAVLVFLDVVGDLASVQDVVEILQECLVYDLCVSHQEGIRDSITP